MLLFNEYLFIHNLFIEYEYIHMNLYESVYCLIEYLFHICLFHKLIMNGSIEVSISYKPFDAYNEQKNSQSGCLSR